MSRKTDRQRVGERKRGDAPLVSQHAAIVFLAIAIVGLLIGGLTLASQRSWPGAILAGLIAAGAALPVVHHLIADH